MHQFPTTAMTLPRILICALLALGGCSDGSENPVAEGPFELAMSEVVFIDESRGTPATGEFPALPTRTLPTLVVIPQGNGSFPLLVFSHGLGSSPQAYQDLIEAVAAAGFAIVAPAFPLTSQNAPNGPDPVDTQQQPGDVSFLIDAVSAAVAAGDAPFSRRIDVNTIGTFGHSNGGITTLGVIGNSCCIDERIDAAVSLSAPAAPFNNGVYDFSATAPLALIHGTVDVLIPFEESVRVFNSVEAAKGLVTMTDVGHSSFLTPSGHGFETSSKTIIDFFRTHLRNDSSAEGRLVAGQSYETSVEVLYSADGGTDVTRPLPPPITNRAAAVEPNSDLEDGQVVTVTWRNFIPGNVINILQCSAGGTGGNDVCDFSNAYILEPNPDGEGSLPLTIITGEVGTGTCGSPTDDCVIVFNDGGLLSEEAIIRVPISFSQ